MESKQDSTFRERQRQQASKRSSDAKALRSRSADDPRGSIARPLGRGEVKPGVQVSSDAVVYRWCRESGTFVPRVEGESR
jgi:hypothetical protein